MIKKLKKGKNRKRVAEYVNNIKKYYKMLKKYEKKTKIKKNKNI